MKLPEREPSSVARLNETTGMIWSGIFSLMIDVTTFCITADVVHVLKIVLITQSVRVTSHQWYGTTTLDTVKRHLFQIVTFNRRN